MKKFASALAVLALSSSAALFAEGAAPAPGNNMMQTGLMLVVALLFFYFILWRPEQKRRKMMEKQRSSLKKGDAVTAMGIVGTVAAINEQTIVVKTGESSKIEILKSAITEVKPAADEASKKVEITE